MTTPEVPARRYALCRVSTGDYLLTSNDGKTLWRLNRYTEDGSAEVETRAGKRRRLRGTFWALWRYTGRDLNAASAEWYDWEQYDSLLPSRKAAIGCALRNS